MKLSFKKLNNLVGLLVFIIAAITYLLTIEPNFSFWDCGEYISSAVKLEVTHSPGAIFFQLLGAVWAILAMGDGTKYSLVINAMSAIMSALTILFLFWTITHLTRKLLFSKIELNDLTAYQKATLILSGAVGALSFTFTDTFWFSAVEGEVYAAASCFTALLLWLMCKWENDDSSRSDRWIVLISLIIGLSVGVHLMVILIVPTLGYIYYIKKYTFTWKSFIIASAVIGFVFILVFKVIFPYTMSFFGKSEIFFVNKLQMPFNTGSIFAFIVIVLVFYFGLKYTHKHKLSLVHTIILSILFMLIGFSSWLALPIRAQANTPINLNDPDNAIGMLDYYNRAQYGDWPVFYGANYTAYLDPNGIIGTEDNGPIYEKNEEEGRYIETGRRFNYKFNPEHISLLPRMYSPDAGAMENYGLMEGYPKFSLNPSFYQNPEAQKIYEDLNSKLENGSIRIRDYQVAKQNDLLKVQKPTLGQNLDFMMTYQMGYMFIRYLLWNFVGKQNDIQGNYESTKGNWISGINFIDKMHLGDQSKLPATYVNKATNKYYFLPLILGFIGFFFQLNRDPRRNFALIAIFLLSSVGIILYTSIKAFEPRERDYALVTSFFTFAIWIGLGVSAIMHQFKKNNQKKIGLVLGILTLGVPLLMGFQNWDDHDRSRRYTAYDFSKSYLEGLDKNNPILFVYGDNDTYPLWALQETEEFRPDAKVINYTLLGTAWYIDQTHRKTYTAPSLPHSLSHEEYRDGVNDQIMLLNKNFWSQLFQQIPAKDLPEEFIKFKKFATQDSLSAKEAINFLKNKDDQKSLKNLLATVYDDRDLNKDDIGLLPVNKFYIPVNKENALKYGIVKPEDANLMVNDIVLTIGRSSLGKDGLAMLDLLANYNWDRSIYFSSGGTYSPSNLMYANNYLEYQGLVSKLSPIYTPNDELGNLGRVNPNTLYQLVKNYKFGNLKDPKAYFDETCRSNIINYRISLGRTAKELANIGENKKSNEILELINTEIPLSMYPATPSYNSIITSYLQIGKEEEGLKLADIYKNQLLDELNYYLSLSPKSQTFVIDDMDNLSNSYTYLISEIANTYLKMNQKEKAVKYIDNSMKPLDKRLQEFKTLGKNSKNTYSASFNNLKFSYGQMFQLLHSIDSVYGKQKAEEILNIYEELK